MELGRRAAWAAQTAAAAAASDDDDDDDRSLEARDSPVGDVPMDGCRSHYC